MERDKDESDSSYEIDKKNKNTVLCTNNYLLNSISKEDYLKQEEYIYEFRIAPNHEIIEVLYKTSYTINPSMFIHEGLKIQSNNHSVQLSQRKNDS